MIITISGMPGSGKSSVAKLLAERLNYDKISIGDLRGKIAQKEGISIDELNKKGETKPYTDKKVDEHQRELGRTKNNFIFDSRLGWYFIPRSFKVFLKVEWQEAARRIYEMQKKGERKDEIRYENIKDALRIIKERVESDNCRYKKWYGIKEFQNKKNYDLVIDTTNKTAKEAAIKILAKVKERVNC